MKRSNSITDVPGILVGQAQNMEALTGCTVIICKKGAVGGVDQRGGAPGTRETDLLRPMHLIEKMHAVVLTGGSAFGLDAAGGVMRYLESQKIGFRTGDTHVPIVSAAVLYDLAIGDLKVRPDEKMGYQACLNASSQPPELGNFGAGTGATVGKFFGMKHAMKSGIGTASIDLGGGLIVAAIIAVNAFGDVVDPITNKIVAGTRSLSSSTSAPGFADTLSQMKNFIGKQVLSIVSSQNTVIGVIATNARLTKEEVNKVAQMAHDGLGRVIRPAHTMFDGDTLFAMATGEKVGNVNIIGAYSAEVTAEAILSAVRHAKSISDYPASSDPILLTRTGGKK